MYRENDTDALHRLAFLNSAKEILSFPADKATNTHLFAVVDCEFGSAMSAWLMTMFAYMISPTERLASGTDDVMLQ